MVRLFQTEKNDDLKNKIAEYTNSQNAISPSDLKSISVMQRRIEAYLGANKIAYIRKTGDTGKDFPGCDRFISMERLAQILYSYNGYPDRASNNKKQLFDKYYKDIFPDEVDFDEILNVITLYFSIVDEYKLHPEIKAFPQKYFVILYILSLKKEMSIYSAISFLEKAMNEFEKESKIALTKKITKVAFKESITKELLKA